MKMKTILLLNMCAFLLCSCINNEKDIWNGLPSLAISLNTSYVELALSEKSSFAESSPYLIAGNNECMDLLCYEQFKTNYTFEEIDKESTSYLDHAKRNRETGEVESIPYFKYTFFLKNVGYRTAQYTMSLNITENSADPATNKTLDDVVRVIVIEDGYIDKVYAKRSPCSNHFDPLEAEETRSFTDLEYICGVPNSENYAGLASPFLNNINIFEDNKIDFQSGDCVRYTILVWLEGDDAECVGVLPKEAKFKLGLQIQASEF